MNNNLKELLKNKNGVELKTWLERNKEKIKDKRIFYVLKANLEKEDVYKIGISERGGTSAYGRLNDYYHFYGTSSKTNPCKGVKLYLVLANTYNVDVNASDSKVRKLETLLKRDFKELRARGEERLNTSIDSIFEYLQKANLIVTETEKPVRETPRLKELNIGSNDAVNKIISSSKLRNGPYIYEVEFKNKTKKKLTYDQLIGMRNGKRIADEYNITHQQK